MFVTSAWGASPQVPMWPLSFQAWKVTLTQVVFPGDLYNHNPIPHPFLPDTSGPSNRVSCSVNFNMSMLLGLAPESQVWHHSGCQLQAL